jgi:hypothetical protein
MLIAPRSTEIACRVRAQAVGVAAARVDAALIVGNRDLVNVELERS